MNDDRNIARRHRHGSAWDALRIDPWAPKPKRSLRVALYVLAVIAGMFLAVRMANAGQATSSGPRNALLTWGAVTTNTDGSTITGPVLYRVYRGARGTAKTPVVTVSVLSLLLEREPLGEQCYQLTAVVGTAESAPSGEQCKVMKLEKPRGRFEQP